MGAQQIRGVFAATFDVEGVVHGACWVIFRRIERGEVEPVTFDLRSLCNLKTHAAENAFNAFQRARNRVQATHTTLTARESHVKRLCLQLCAKFSFSELLTTFCQGRLNRLFGLIDSGAAGFLFLHRELCQTLHPLGDQPGFSQKPRLGVFQVIGGGGLRKLCAGGSDKGVKIGRHGVIMQSKTEHGNTDVFGPILQE